MQNERFHNWRPIRLYGHGLQPRTGKHWNCSPAWDIIAVYEHADEIIRHPDFYRSRQPGATGEFAKKDAVKHVFWNRHIDRRFHIEYPHATRHGPRVQGKTIRNPDREWDALIEHRDRCLRNAGLTLSSSPEAIARCLAASFGYDQFKTKPLCQTFPENPRELSSPIEGLLHQSFCVGCALAFVILADSCGLPARSIGCGAHRVAEVLVDGRWHLVDSVGRHETHRELDTFFRGSFMDTMLDPLGDWGDHIMDDYRDGLFGRPNGQYHFPAGEWDGPYTLRFAASNAYAIYPDAPRWGIVSEDGIRLPILRRSGGFYWPIVHSSCAENLRQVRRTALPLPASPEGASRDYLYQPFRPGDKLRQSVWFDALDDMIEMEIVLTFGASQVTDFSVETGRHLILRIGDFQKSLWDLNAWPPQAPDRETIKQPTSGENLASLVRLHTKYFRENSVNWIELHQNSATLLYIPCLPEILEPYIAPLWTETEDKANPPAP